MAQKRKLTDQNLYELLGVLSSATEQEIKQAYRKKALKCHPDKNPDNPKAAELFHELSETLALLTDEKAREAYDRTLKAKELAKERHRELDSKRKKFKEDLERREAAARDDAIARAAAKRSYSANLSEEEALQKEVERLRKEGSQALQEEQELIRQQILKDQQGKFSFVSAADAKVPITEGPRLRVKWGKSGNPMSYDSLMKTFSQYGKVATLVVGKKSAIVEMEDQREADEAYEGESTNLQLEWLSKSGSNNESISSTPVSTTTSTSSTTFPAFKSTTSGSSQPLSNASQPPSTSSFADFEAMILEKLSAAVAAQKSTPASDSNID